MIDYYDFRDLVRDTLFRNMTLPAVSLPYVLSRKTMDIPTRNVIGVQETLNLARLEDLADYLSVDSEKINIESRVFVRDSRSSIRNLWYVAWHNAFVLDDLATSVTAGIMEDGFFVLSFPPLIRLAKEVPSMITDW